MKKDIVLMSLTNRDFSTYKLFEFPWLDHEPHKFQSIFEFNIDAMIYLVQSSNSRSVIAVHCKAGKGRTGLMIWCLLVFLGFKFINEAKDVLPEEENLNEPIRFDELFKIKEVEERIDSNDKEELATEIYFQSLESLLKYWDWIVKYFDKNRTKDKKGITIQSQIRFIRMYTLYLFNRFKLQAICENGNPEPYFSFYTDVLNELSKKSLEEIKPPKNLPLLVPLRKLMKSNNELLNYKIKLYKLEYQGYKSTKNINVEIVDRDITKLFILSKKKIYGDKENNSVNFSNEKNPDLGGDFEIIIKMGKEKLWAWFNVSFLVQVAFLEQKWEKEEKCIYNC